MLLLALLWLLPAASPRDEDRAVALDTVLGQERAESDPQAPDEPEAELGVGFESPSALVAAFFAAADKADDEKGAAWTEAGQVFDLTQHREFERELLGRTKARKLLEIWNRVEVIDPADFPRGAAAARLDTWTYRGIPPGREDLAFELVFEKGADDLWRIGPDSSDRIDDVYLSVFELETVGGVRAKALALNERVRRAVPTALQRTGFLLEHWQWLGLLVLVALGVVLERFVSLSFRRFVNKRSAGRVDKEVLTRLVRPTSLLAVMLVLGAGLPLLDLHSDVLGPFDLGVHFVLGLAGIWTAYRFVDVLAWYLGERARHTKNTFDDMIVPLVRRTLKIFVVLLGGIWVASRVTEDLWGVFAGLGIGSLAVGFAAKDSIENLFGTFTVLMDKPFQLGDWIKVGGLEGSVAEVGFRSTRIRTFYDSLISVPNSTFIDSEVDNLGARSWRRISTKLGVTYDTPAVKIDAFCEGIRQLIRDHPYTRKDSYHVYLNSFGASSLEILLYCFHGTPDWSTELRERHRLFLDIVRLAERLGVEFAFPTQTVHLLRPDELPTHDGLPSSVDDARYQGKQVGSQIAAEGLAEYGGEKPPPVVIE